MLNQRFARFAWGTLIYNLLVIAWGAYVRGSFSGDGCGPHWPDCNGGFILTAPRVATIIEYSHRVTTAIDGIVVVLLLVAAFRLFPKGHPVRLGAVLSFVFIVAEALVGAWLVHFKLVAHNQSVYRAVATPVHLMTTFGLIAVLTLTAWWASGGQPLRLRGQGAVGWALGIGLVVTLLLGVSGAVTALGDMLFPARDLISGIRQDFAPTAHFLIRLRVLHPLIAISVGLYLILIAGLVMHLRPSEAVRRFGSIIGGLFLAQIALGFISIWLQVPLYLQLAHLLLADLLWIDLVLLAAASFGVDVPRVETSDLHVPERSDAHEGAGVATWGDYVSLTKPKVISLLLLTTLTAMVIAAGGWPGTWLFFAVAIGGYMSAGAANTINMVIDRDIDGRMKRTAKRPTVTQTIPSGNALFFAFALAVGAFGLLWGAGNLLCAMLSLAGLMFYVVVYTLLLKRRTWHNIVIGGAAGAFPPLVGWTAVTGHLSLLAWGLFAIVFLWTPVHFWALALMIKDEYAGVGVPMLPCVHGARATVIQIVVYTGLTIAISALPVAIGEVSWVYLTAVVMLILMLLVRSVQLFLGYNERPRAVSLYKYSMLYLALLFLAMALDRSFLTGRRITPLTTVHAAPANEFVATKYKVSEGTRPSL